MVVNIHPRVYSCVNIICVEFFELKLKEQSYQCSCAILIKDSLFHKILSHSEIIFWTVFINC